MKKLDHNIEAYSKDNAYFKENYYSQRWFANKLIVSSSKDKSKVLDLGIGLGIITYLLSEYFENYSVIDADRGIIEDYKKKYPKSKANIIQSFFEDYECAEKYDLIIMNNILEHLSDPILVLKKYAQYLNDGGRIAIAVPNAESIHRRLGIYMGTLNDIKMFSEMDVALGHKRYYTVDTIKYDINKSGLVIQKIEGIYFKPFTTKQIDSLCLTENVYDALFKLGALYPELCNSLYIECIKK